MEQARLEVEVEHERTSRAAFEAQFSWRIIDESHLASLTAALSKSVHSVSLEFPSGDQEALFFATQLMGALTEAGWTVSPKAVSSPMGIFGMTVPGPENEAVLDLRTTLKTAGLSPGTSDVAAPTAFFGSQGAAVPEARIVIGPKLSAEVMRALASVQNHRVANPPPAPPPP